MKMKKVEIEFNKKGVVVRQRVLMPFGDEEIVEKVYPYEDISKKRWSLKVYEIKPKILDGILKSIIIHGEYGGFEPPEISPDGNIDEIIKKYFPNAKGQSLMDLKGIVKYLLKNNVSENDIEKVRSGRRDAIKKIARERGVSESAVLSNVTRGLHINVDELDNKLREIISSYRESKQ